MKNCEVSGLTGSVNGDSESFDLIALLKRMSLSVKCFKLNEDKTGV